MIGATTESVAKYISEGQFGLWQEDAQYIRALNEGAKLGLGAGEALGEDCRAQLPLCPVQCAGGLL